MIILPILDLNECETHSPCNTEGTSDCENIPGSYRCNCNAGYTGKYCEEGMPSRTRHLKKIIVLNRTGLHFVILKLKISNKMRMNVSSWSGTWPRPCKIKICYVNKDTKSRPPTPPPCQIKFSMRDPLWHDNLLITVFWFSRCIYFLKILTIVCQIHALTEENARTPWDLSLVSVKVAWQENFANKVNYFKCRLITLLSSLTTL